MLILVLFLMEFYPGDSGGDGDGAVGIRCWTLGVAEHYYNGTVVYLTGNLTIRAGERYVYDGSMVIFNCTSDGGVELRVERGGELIIRNGTKLTINRTGNYSNNYGYNYVVRAELGSRIRIEDSNISYAGYGDRDKSGLVIYADNVTIRNTKFYRCYSGIYFRACNNSRVENCTFFEIEKNAVSYEALYFEYEVGTTHNVTECKFINIGGTGLWANENIRHLNVSSSYFVNCSTGIFARTVSFFVYNNTILNSTTGILFIDAYKMRIELNRLKSCQKGISLENAGCTAIEMNIIENCSTGINAYRNFPYYYLLIRFNSIRNASTGVDITYSDNVTVEGNSIEKCKDYGIKYFGHFTTRFGNFYLHNRLSYNEYGIYIRSKDVGLIQDNNFIGNTHSGIYLYDAYNLTIVNNTIKHSMMGILAISCKDLRITECNISNVEEGVNLTSCSNIIFSITSISNTNGVLKILYTTNGWFELNSFNDSEVGIFVNERSSHLTFTKNQFNRNPCHAVDLGSSQWDFNGYGNYWGGVEDYHDWNGDGIVDRPYVIDEDSVDHYPLIKPWGEPYNRGIRLVRVPGNGTRVAAGRWFNYTFRAEDPDGDRPWYELVSYPEVNFTLENTTGNFSYMPGEGDVGRVNFTVTVYDRNGSRDSISFYLVVLPPNNPPIVGEIGRVRVVVGEVGRVYLNISDPDGDDVSVRVVSSEAPFELHFYYYEYIWFRTSEGDEGIYRVVLEVDDNNGSVVRVVFEIEVIPPNREPIVEGIVDQECYVGDEFRYQVIARDPNPDDVLTYRIEYSGRGFAEIDEGGLILIIPAIEDVGVQEVRVWVSDNNGSEVMVRFNLTVKERNHAPEGDEHVEVVVSAGDVIEVGLDVEDSDGDELVVGVEGERPRWLRVEGLVLYLSPRIEDIGDYTIYLNVSDGRGGYLEVELRVMVVEGEVPVLLLPERVVMKERERSEIHYEVEYRGNGSVYVQLLTEYGWCEEVDGGIILEPEDGDAGRYELRFEVGVEGGVSGEVGMDVEIERNLTTLQCEVSVIPYRDEYKVGEEVIFRVVWSGYGGELGFHWEVLLGGERYFEGNGTEVRVRFDRAGEYVVRVSVVGEGAPIEEAVIDVREEGVGGGGRMWRVVIGAVITLVVIVILVVLYFKGGINRLNLFKRAEGQGSPQRSQRGGF